MASTSIKSKKEAQLAEQILDELGVTGKTLPVDVDAILAAKGFVVDERGLPENLAAVLDMRREGNPVLLVDKNLGAEQKRLMKAYELGHFLLKPKFNGVRTDRLPPLATPLGGVPMDKDCKSANRFAYALLIPKTLFDEQIRLNADKAEDDLARALAAAFGVSATAVVMARLLYPTFG